MKRSVVIAVQLALIFFISSCGKTTCLNPGIHLAFNGYDSATLSRVLVEQYVTNSNFATLVSISVFDTANAQILQSNDTVYMPRIDTSSIVIAPGYDYIIRIPAAPAVFADSAFKITKISYTDVKRKVSGSGGCTNNVSYYLDSIPFQVTGTTFSETNLPSVNIVLNK
jgi:hypothetical protein